MAKKKITGFTATTTWDGADLIPVVINVATTPASRKMTLANFFASITGPILVASSNGINIDTTTGDDSDIDVLTLDVTGSPKLWWDESEDAFAVTNPLLLDSIKIKGASIGADNFCVNALDNVIEAASTRNVISGGGSATAPNKIGSATKPVGGSATFPVGHDVNDTDYVAESVYVAMIGGGYDHINNQIAGTICGGGHNFIKYNVGGHGVIVGGSYNLVTGLYAFLGGGSANCVSTGSNSALVGGSLNVVSGDYSSIGGGLSNIVTGNYSSILGGRLGVCTGNNSVVLGGYGSEVVAAYALAFGRRAKLSGDGSVVFCDSTNEDYTVTGVNCFRTRFSGGYHFTGGKVDLFGNITGAGSNNLMIWNTGTVSNEVGIGFKTSTGNDTGNYYAGRIYGKFDGNNYVNARITIQTSTTLDALVDTLTLKDAKVGIGTLTPAVALQVADAIAVSSSTEGNTARLTRHAVREVVTLTGATKVTTLDIPAGALLLGASFCVNTAVSDDTADPDTWSAAFSGGSTATLATAAAAAKQTKVDTLIVPAVAASTTNVTFTPQGGSFDGGVIEVVVYYEALTSLANGA